MPNDYRISLGLTTAGDFIYVLDHLALKQSSINIGFYEFDDISLHEIKTEKIVRV